MTADTNIEFRDAMKTAANWFARLHADDCDEQDREGFAQWLSQNDAHRKAFNSISMAYDVSGTEHARWQEDLRRVTEPTQQRISEETLPSAQHALAQAAPVSRRKILAGAAFLVAGTGGIGWQAAYAGVVKTGFGERKSLRLDGGYMLQMDAETTIRQPWLRPRKLELQQGRISLQTVPNGADPFTLIVPGHEIIGQAMDVDVCVAASRLTISVLRGDVHIAQPGKPPLILHQGDRLNAQGAVDRPTMAPLIAWRNGQLIFQNSSLHAACEQLNRYDAMRLVPDTGAGAMRISGTFSMGQNAQFAKAMKELLNVETRSEGQSIYIST